MPDCQEELLFDSSASLRFTTQLLARCDIIGLHVPDEFFLKPALNMLKQQTQNAPPFCMASARRLSSR